MSAFLFSAAYKGFNALSSYLGRMIKTNEKFADSLARIKGNLLTAFQPIYEAVSPALETMLGLVADVTRGIAQLVSVIFGKSVKSSAEAAKKQYEMSDAIESTGEAARASAEVSGLLRRTEHSGHVRECGRIRRDRRGGRDRGVV